MRNKFRNLPIIAAIVISLAAGSANYTSASIYTGSVSWSSTSSTIFATPSWNQAGTSLSWVVSQNQNGSWHYKYTWNTNLKAVSHIIFEVSANVVAADFSNVSVTGGSLDAVGNYGIGNSGNPSIPGYMRGVKFDTPSGFTNVVIEFDIFRVPTWGDFYAKDGKVNNVDTVAWNTGFANGETSGAGNDPTSAAANGSLNGHILRPDTFSSFIQVPEPTTMTIWALLGGTGLVVSRRRNGR